MNKILGTIILIVAGLFLLPWNRVDWGKVSMMPSQTITVTGEARSQQKNQVASFTAGVDAVKDKKEEAVKEVNDKVAAIIEAAKKFGIDEGNIKTQNLSIYQSEEMYWDNGVQKSRKGQWRVNNSVEVTLKEVTRASELADLLTNSGANNVYGPNSRFDDTREIEKTLFDEAMKNAREKAEIIAKASGRNLGKVISVNEAGSVTETNLMYRMEGAGGGGAPIEPGSGTVSKTVTVSFEMK